MPAFPPTGGTGGMQPPLNPVAVYVSGSGNDANDGTSWSKAVLTTDRALNILEAAGGGQMHVHSIAGEVNGNIWLRGDGRTIPGWHGDFPLEIIGYGLTHTAFGFPSAALGGGSQADNFHPLLWLAGTFQPKIFRNIYPYNYINQFIRAWDYRRDVAGNIVLTNIVSWVRSGTLATVTIGLPAAYNVLELDRTGGSGLVTMTIDVPRRDMSPIQVGQVIRVVSTDPNFDSGDFVITERVSAAVPQIVKYVQSTTSGSGPITALNPGTVQYAAIGVRDRIQVVSSQPLNVASTMYQVTGLQNGDVPVADVITIADLYGGQPIGNSDGSGTLGTYPSSGTFTSPGTWVHQDRYSYNFSSVDFYNIGCFGRGSPNYDISMAGPNIDFGSSNDGRLRFFFSAPGGYVPVHGCPDPDREAALFFDPGSQNGVACEAYYMRPASRGMRFWSSVGNTWDLRLVSFLGDAPFGDTNTPPLVEVLGDSIAGQVFIDNCLNSDSVGNNPNIRISACAPGSMVINSGPTEGPVIVMGTQGQPHVIPAAQGQQGFWASGVNRVSLAADMPNVRRAFPLAMARVANLVPDEGSWNTGGATITSGQSGPYGGTNAKKIQGGTGAYLLQDQPVSLANGDTFVIGLWARRDGGFSGASILNFSVQDNLGNVVAQQYISPFAGDGEWQAISVPVTVQNLTGSSWSMSLAFSGDAVSSPGTIYYLPFLELLPAATYSANEIGEYAQTISNRTRYLQPGFVGTPDNIKFIGHGGLGTAKHYTSGASSGQITVGASNSKYVELFDESGTSLGVFGPGSAFTVNP